MSAIKVEDYKSESQNSESLDATLSTDKKIKIEQSEIDSAKIDDMLNTGNGFQGGLPGCPVKTETDVKSRDTKVDIKFVHVKSEFDDVTYPNEELIIKHDGEIDQNSTDTAEESVEMGDSSPPKKRAKKSHFDAKTKEIILNMYQLETQVNPLVPINEIVNKVAAQSGSSSRSVYRILQEYKSKHAFSEPKTNQNRKHIVDLVDDFDRQAIRRKVHQYFFKNELPTLEKVLRDVNDDPQLPNFKRTTFYKFLKSLNFKYAKRGSYSMLLDRNVIVLWRRKYLEKIQSYRNENRKIYYLDETSINAGHTILDGLSTGLKNPSGKGKRVIICHIGSEDGFVKGGLCSFESKKSGVNQVEMDGNSFERWFQNILPQLEENCVIVLDNAPYHTRRLEKIPTTAMKKSEIQDWLRSKAIPFDENLLKAELLSIVNTHKKQYQKYVIDEMAASQNKTVLRLPPYHGELNPMELIWADVRNYVAANNKTFEFADITSIFDDAISKVTPDKWKNCFQHVQKKVEKQMWDLDNIIEAHVELLLINVDTDSSSDESEC